MNLDLFIICISILWLGIGAVLGFLLGSVIEVADEYDAMHRHRDQMDALAELTTRKP